MSELKSCAVCSGENTLYQHTTNTKLYANTFDGARTLVTKVNRCPPYADCCMKDVPARSALIINFCPECGRALSDYAQPDQLREATQLIPEMSLEDAIEHAKEKAVNLGDCQCAAEHAQLAEWLEELVGRRAQPDITGETSDGYHTFNELYHHRAVLFSVICNSRPDIAWRAKRHHDGTMYDGMFIVGINTPDGQATYHYDVEPYWDMFCVKELPNAPEWDGHTPAQAIERIGKLTAQPDNEPLTCDGCLYSEDYFDPVPCHGCSRVRNTNDCYRQKPEGGEPHA